MHRRVEYKSVKSEVFAAALLRMLELRSFEVTLAGACGRRTDVIGSMFHLREFARFAFDG
jgi:hypothetical protein